MFGTPYFSVSSFADQSFPAHLTQAVTGQAIAAATQSVTVSGKANVSVTGQAAGSVVGSVTTSGKANVSVTGQAMGSALSSVTLNVETIFLTGNSIASNTSTPTINTDHSVFVTGQSIGTTINPNPFQINLTANISVTGTGLIAGVTAPNVYQDLEVEIDEDVTTNWIDIFNESFTQSIASTHSGSAFSGVGFSSTDDGEAIANNPAPDGNWTEIEEASTIWEEIP
tara:strand:+ start:7750 stop:8427 length:678 start_codon:yes stop_codon:yes gene_type:complete